MRTAIYYRVSDPKQANEGFGFDAQRRLLPEHARRMGWVVVREYEEPGISADSLTQRPQMMRLLEDAARGEFDLALAIEDTRFSRGDMLDWGFIVNVCDQAGVQLVTPNGVVYQPGDDESRLMLWFRGGMSEAEKLRIAKRMMRGKREAMEQGCLVQGKAPFGYRFERHVPPGCKKPKASHKRLVIVEEEAEVVRLIFRMLAEGKGFHRIAQHLNEVLSKPAPRGGPWKIATLYRIARNPVYKGQWVFGRVKHCAPAKPRVAQPKRPGQSSARPNAPEKWITQEDPEIIPAIVTEELWEAVSAALARRNHNDRGRPSTQEHKPLLTGFLRCPHCGYAISHYRTSYTDKRRGKLYTRQYVCGGRTNWKRWHISPCDNRRWKAEDVEAAVWAKLVEIIRSPDLLREIIDASEADAPAVDSSELVVIQRTLSGIDQATERVKAAYRAGVYSLEELEAELSKIRNERETLEGRLLTVEQQVSARAEWEACVTDAIERCREYRDLVETAAPEERRGMLEDLVEEITLDRDGNLQILLLFGTAHPARLGSPAPGRALQPPPAPSPLANSVCMSRSRRT